MSQTIEDKIKKIEHSLAFYKGGFFVASIAILGFIGVSSFILIPNAAVKAFEEKNVDVVLENLRGGEESAKKLIKLSENLEIFKSLPIGAVIPFYNVKPNNCSSLGGDWKDFEDIQGRFIIGSGVLDNRPYLINDIGGSHITEIMLANMPSHSHVTNNATDSTYSPFGISNQNLNGLGGTRAPKYPTFSKTKSSGGGQPIDNMPPFLVLTYCVKI